MKSTGRSAGIRSLPYKNYRMVDMARPVWGVLFYFKIASYGSNSNSFVPG
nr:MAG TPA: hypothetical protein [Caudoviricetes sp.]